jgi:hypothetical protein
VLRLPCLLGRLALYFRGRGERGVRLECVELGAQEGGLFREVGLQCFDVGELVAQGLRGQGVLDECVREGLGVCAGGVEGGGGGGEGGEGLGAFGREAGF